MEGTSLQGEGLEQSGVNKPGIFMFSDVFRTAWRSLGLSLSLAFPLRRIFLNIAMYRASDHQPGRPDISQMCSFGFISRTEHVKLLRHPVLLLFFRSNLSHVAKSIFTQPEDGAGGKQLQRVLGSWLVGLFVCRKAAVEQEGGGGAHTTLLKIVGKSR